MNSRERVICAIQFTEPDRIPFEHAIFPGAFKRHGQQLVDFLNMYPDDFGHQNFSLPEFVDYPEDHLEEYRDEWGPHWVRLYGYTAGEVKRPALPSWDQLHNYQFPPIPDSKHFEDLKIVLRLITSTIQPVVEELYLSGCSTFVGQKTSTMTLVTTVQNYTNWQIVWWNII